MTRARTAARNHPPSTAKTLSIRLGTVGSLALSVLSLIACGGEMQPADVVTDRGVRDTGAEMDSGVISQPDVMSQPDVSSQPDIASQPDVASMDVGSSNSCCRAFSLANQAQCDALDVSGPSSCNAFNDGTTCAWSLEARCNDSGVPIDAGPPPNCCLAINAANAAFCSALSSFGTDRCNRADGGGVCVWSGAMVCNPAPPMDSGVVADSSTDGAVRIDVTLRDVASDARDSGVIVDSGVPSCCMARNGTATNLSYCRTQATMALCGSATAALRTCVWNATPLCTSSLGSNGACCIPRTLVALQPTCAVLATSATCGANAGCQWRCP